MQVDDFDVPASSDEELDDVDLGSSGEDGQGLDKSALFGSASTSLVCLHQAQFVCAISQVAS